jgi:transcriptional regulator with XRE-family HTH domain
MPRVLMSRGGHDRQALNHELARLPRDLTTAITWSMKQQGMNRADLARALGVTPGRVSQILSGDGNLTLRTLAAVCVALDVRLDAKLVPNKGDFPEKDEQYPRSTAAPQTVPGSPAAPART